MADITLDFSTLEIYDMDGTKIEAISPLANAVWRLANNLELVDIARKIMTKDKITLRESELKEIEKIVYTDERAGFFAFYKKQFKDWIEKQKADK